MSKETVTTKPTYKELENSVLDFWAFFGTDIEEETIDSLKLKAYERANALVRRIKNAK